MWRLRPQAGAGVLPVVEAAVVTNRGADCIMRCGTTVLRRGMTIQLPHRAWRATEQRGDQDLRHPSPRQRDRG